MDFCYRRVYGYWEDEYEGLEDLWYLVKSFYKVDFNVIAQRRGYSYGVVKTPHAFNNNNSISAYRNYKLLLI